MNTHLTDLLVDFPLEPSRSKIGSWDYLIKPFIIFQSQVSLDMFALLVKAATLQNLPKWELNWTVPFCILLS